MPKSAPDAPDVADVIPEEDRRFRSLELAERHFPEERRRVVADFFRVTVDNPGLLPLIALCALHGFSPTEGLVNLLPHREKIVNADATETVVLRWSPVIGRDGLLTLAMRTLGRPYGYRGHIGQALCANDRISVRYTGDAIVDPIVLHEFAEMPAEFPQGADPAAWRGPVCGAWAKAHWDGRPASFYYADVREHGRTEIAPSGDDGAPEGKVWVGAWPYTSAMSMKCAQSAVFRWGQGVTGFVPIDELRDVGAWQRGEPMSALFVDRGADVVEFDFEQVRDRRLRRRLEAAVARANELDPFAWGPARCAMVMLRREPAELRAIARSIEIANEERAKAEASS